MEKHFGLSATATDGLRRHSTWENHTMTSTTVPTSVVFMGTRIPDPLGAGPSVHFSDPQLPIVYRSMSPIKVYGRR